MIYKEIKNWLFGMIRTSPTKGEGTFSPLMGGIKGW